MLTNNLRACIGDLGIAQSLGTRARTAVGFDCSHAAPEQLLGQRCTLAADMYSFGVLLVELATGRVVTRRGNWQLPRAPEQCSQAVRALIQQCLSLEPGQRPTSTQALQLLRADAVASGSRGG